MVATRDPAADPTPAELSRRFEALFADPEERSRRLGIEQEYGVFEGDRQIDFGPLVDAHGFEGAPLHPTNSRAYQTPSGLLLMADGVVAEAASPPVSLDAGFVDHLEAWGARGRAAIEAALVDGLRLVGGSTHLSVEVPHAVNEQLCDLYAQTFAPALMLLMDHQQSPGLLIRPRPGRTELCGEFVHGARLRAALAFAAGSVLATQAQLEHRGDDALFPAQLQVLVEQGRQRHGLYVDRTAFGPDIYEHGRETQLRRRDGGTVSAQQHLEHCWRAARSALQAAGISSADLDAADRVVGGSLPLPSELAELDDAACAASTHRQCGDDCHDQREAATVADRHGLILSPNAPPDLELRPISATWDFAAFEVSSVTAPSRSVVVSVPERQLDQFLDRVGDGAFTPILSEYLAQPVTNRVLATSEQTTTPGIFDSVTPNPQLLPPDLMGVGPGATNPRRPDKRGDEEEPRIALPSPASRFPRGLLIAVGGVFALLAVGLVIVLGGGSDDETPGIDPGNGQSTTEPSGSSGGQSGGQTEVPSGGAVAVDQLGLFEFLDDGVIEFAIEGDRIVGRTIRPPLSGGIDLVGGASQCPEFADDVVFDLDLDGNGEWFWYNTFPCARIATGGEVNVSFFLGGADATGFRPPEHPLADGVSLVLSMPRSSGVSTFNPRIVDVLDPAGDLRSDDGPGCTDFSSGAPTPRGDVIDILAAAIVPLEEGGYRLTVHLAAPPFSDPFGEVAYVLNVGSLQHRDAPGDPAGSGPILGTFVWTQFHPFEGPPNAVGAGITDPADPWATLEVVGSSVVFEINRLPDDVAATDIDVEITGGFGQPDRIGGIGCFDEVLLPAFR